ncbi:exo-alpha-sialidase, partial [Trypanosoma cruzi]
MRKHIRRACDHRSQMNPVQTPSKSNSPFLKPFLHSMRPDPHPHVPTHTSRKRMVVAAQRSGNTCPARTRITNDMRNRTAQRRRSAHLKGCGPPQQSQPIARITPAGRVTRGARSLSPPLASCPRRKQQPPA